MLARRGKFLSKPESYVFVYLDMQGRLRWTSEMFFERLAAEMASAGVNTSSITDYDSVEQWCRSLQQEGRALVILIDEFQVLMREDGGAEQLPVEFFNYLRSLANSYPVSLVVTSHVDLYTLSTDHRLSGSPLFNILHKLHLGPFTEAETRELIAVSLHAGCVLAADEPWIISRGGHHPLYLQIACSTAFDWRTENVPRRRSTASSSIAASWRRRFRTSRACGSFSPMASVESCRPPRVAMRRAPRSRPRLNISKNADICGAKAAISSSSASASVSSSRTGRRRSRDGRRGYACRSPACRSCACGAAGEGLHQLRT